MLGGVVGVGSLQDLEVLFRASSVDLVRRFGARRVGDNYVLPISTTPWFTMVDLGGGYALVRDGRPLRIVDVRLVGYVQRPWFMVVIGFVINEQFIVGVVVTGVRSVSGCRAIPLTPPLDLYELPRNVVFPRPVALVHEVSVGDVVEVDVPLECLGDFGIDPGSVANQLLMYTNLVSNMARVQVDLRQARITY